MLVTASYIFVQKHIVHYILYHIFLNSATYIFVEEEFFCEG